MQKLSRMAGFGFIENVPLLSGFDNNTIHYLEFYHHCAGPSLAGIYDKAFWSRTCLQMAHSEPSVRHAVIALGFLNKIESGSIKDARSLPTVDSRQTLLDHYNLSVKHLVKRIAEASYTPEVALVTCVLFVCIEFLRADYRTAFMHLSNGLKIVSEWRRKRPSGCAAEDNIQEIQNSHNGAPMIEDELVPILTRCITSALLYGEIIETDIAIPLNPARVCLQQTFETLAEVESYNRELRNASVSYVLRVGASLSTGVPVTPGDRQEQTCLLDCHHNLSRHLALFESKIHLSSEDRVCVSQLQVSYYNTYIGVACATEALQLPYDAHLESFQALIHHAEIVLKAAYRSASSTASFTFDIGIIPSLYFAATRCRCPVTRRKAVSLLARTSRREGMWDAEQHVLVAKRVIELEESEVDGTTGWPMERTRLWRTTVSADVGRDGAFRIFLVPASWVGKIGPDGKPKTLTEWHVL
jgi:hypothetical protein